jgi:hypothetical protein
MFTKLLHDPPARWLAPIFFLTCVQGATAAPPATPLDLPELPTLEERHPELYDKYGCEKNFPPEHRAICRANKAEEKAKAEAKAPLTDAERARLLASPAELNEDKGLRGFSGPYYTPLPSANAAVVLEETVGTSATALGNFSAVGLVRNETLEPITAITVTAKLLDKGGEVLAQEATRALVEPLRPGEPAPFQLTTAVAFKDVARVQWSVEWRMEEGKAKLGWRDVEITGLNRGPVSWGNRERDDFDTATAPPYPHLDIGSVKNLSGKDIPNPRMVMAWYEQTGESSGRLIAVVTAPLFDDAYPPRKKAKVLEGRMPSRPKDCTAVLQCGGLKDYIIEVADQKLARRIDKGELVSMFWVTGK